MPITITPRIQCNKCQKVIYAFTIMKITEPISPEEMMNGATQKGWVYGDGYTLCPGCK